MGVKDYSGGDPILRHLSPLRGGLVRGICVAKDSVAEFGQLVYGLVIEIPATTGRPGHRMIAWIMCDPEGNGPGFLDIQND